MLLMCCVLVVGVDEGVNDMKLVHKIHAYKLTASKVSVRKCN